MREEGGRHMRVRGWTKKTSGATTQGMFTYLKVPIHFRIETKKRLFNVGMMMMVTLSKYEFANYSISC